MNAAVNKLVAYIQFELMRGRITAVQADAIKKLLADVEKDIAIVRGLAADMSIL